MDVSRAYNLLENQRTRYNFDPSRLGPDRERGDGAEPGVETLEVL